MLGQTWWSPVAWTNFRPIAALTHFFNGRCPQHLLKCPSQYVTKPVLLSRNRAFWKRSLHQIACVASVSMEQRAFSFPELMCLLVSTKTRGLWERDWAKSEERGFRRFDRSIYRSVLLCSRTAQKRLLRRLHFRGIWKRWLCYRTHCGYFRQWCPAYQEGQLVCHETSMSLNKFLCHETELSENALHARGIWKRRLCYRTHCGYFRQWSPAYQEGQSLRFSLHVSVFGS